MQREGCCLSLPAWKTSLLPSPLPPRAPYNQEKNRYGDVPCLDQTRVKLAKPYSRPEVSQPRMETWVPPGAAVAIPATGLQRDYDVPIFLPPQLTDYINASFMDGYKQRNAYIGTQGMASKPLWEPPRGFFSSCPSTSPPGFVPQASAGGWSIPEQRRGDRC